MPISDIVDKHFHYTYSNGWSYENWIKSPDRIAYVVHSGPMQGRMSYQHCYIQEIRQSEIFMISFVEEADTVVTITIDIPKMTLSSFIAFSKGHWTNPEQARGDKRDPEILERNRRLAGQGGPADRKIVSTYATITKVETGRGIIPELDVKLPTH